MRDIGGALNNTMGSGILFDAAKLEMVGKKDYLPQVYGAAIGSRGRLLLFLFLGTLVNAYASLPVLADFQARAHDQQQVHPSKGNIVSIAAIKITIAAFIGVHG